MNKIDILKNMLFAVKYASSHKLNTITFENIDPSIKKNEASLMALTSNAFYDSSNILLNNFEEKLNDVPVDVLKQDEIISEGITFTPIYLSKLVASICKKYISDSNVNLIGDVCSGMGSFIYSLNTVFPEYKTLSFEKNALLYELSSIIFANDNNSIINTDTLKNTDKYNGCFDIIVGNPPYVRLQNIDNSLKEYLEQADQYKNFLFGSYDLSVAFIIRIYELLRENGIAGLILSRKLLSSNYGEKICSFLSENTQILEIIDFGDNQMFYDKTTYTMIIVFRKSKPKSTYSFKHCLIPTQHIVNETTLLQLINECTRTYESCVLSDYPWSFSNETELTVLSKFKNNGLSIKKLFSIVQGFRTGDNKSFIVNDIDGKYIRPYVDGKCIGRGIIKKTYKIIWPYIEKENEYMLIPLYELSSGNKAAYEHLLSHRKPKEYVELHSYARPQNMSAMDSAKIFVKEMMPSAEFAADCKGNICFGSGYALIPIQNLPELYLKAWSYVLSTEIMEYQYRHISTNLHSGWFRMYKGHIEKIYLPIINFNNEEFIKIIHAIDNNPQDSIPWQNLNTYLCKSLCIDDTEKSIISGYIQRYHEFSIKNKSKGNAEMAIKENEYTDKIQDTAYPDLSIEDRNLYYPVELTMFNKLHEYEDNYRSLVTFQNDKKSPIQRWYKYTQGFSEKLVSALIKELNIKETDLVFDPFCGSGTTLLTAKKNNIPSIGCDVSPLSCWISKIKIHNWSSENAEHISNALTTLEYGCKYTYQNLQFKKFFEKAFYPEILSQTIHIKDWIDSTNLLEIEKDFLRLALISIQEEISFIRKHGSHYRFLNDNSHVGVNKLNIEIIEENSDITVTFKNKVKDMLSDISMIDWNNSIDSNIICDNILQLSQDIQADAVITSPPYLNRNNYFSQQKIELSLLNLISSTDEYSRLVKKSFCSHVEATLPNKPISVIPEVNTIIEAVERRKSNNAKIPHMIAGYFNDLDSFFNKLPQFIKPNASVAFVVANCRWNGVVIPVDHLVCRISEKYGFKPQKIIVARMKGNSPQQMQEFGKIPVRESIVILKYTKKGV